MHLICQRPRSYGEYLTPLGWGASLGILGRGNAVAQAVARTRSGFDKAGLPLPFGAGRGKAVVVLHPGVARSVPADVSPRTFPCSAGFLLRAEGVPGRGEELLVLLHRRGGQSRRLVSIPPPP